MASTRGRRCAWCGLLAMAVFGLGSLNGDLHAEQLPRGTCDAAVQEAPLDFTLNDINGNAVNLASYKGNVVVLNFWATWCGPCKVEVPRLIKLQDTYRAKGLTIVGLSLDTNLQKVHDYARRMKMNYPIFMIGEDHAIQKAFAPLWGVPATVLIRQDGLICRRQLGFVATRDFDNRVKALIRAPR